MNSQNEGPDLRRVGLAPDYWHPIGRSRDLLPGKMLSASFAGEPIVLVREGDAPPFALEDRCAHRQVPLHKGVVDGGRVRCGYHGWTYDRAGRCVNIPYLDAAKTPNGVRAYPCREAYGLLFVFPGDPAKADATPFPAVPSFADPAYKTRFLDRSIDCHYSFMHENLMDMNHQFLHRSLMGTIRPRLLGYDRADNSVEARYTFTRTAGRSSWGERFMIGRWKSSPDEPKDDIMTIRTDYPYQTLTFRTAGSEKPALDLWLSYVPLDAELRSNRSFGLMMIRRPNIPGLIHLLWPFIVWFTDGIFAQDRRIVEMEQRAHDAQGGDWNQELFPVIKALRELLMRKGVGRY